MLGKCKMNASSNQGTHPDMDFFFPFLNLCDAYSLFPFSQTSLLHLSFISEASYFPQFHIYVVSSEKAVFTLAQSMLTLFLVFYFTKIC